MTAQTTTPAPVATLPTCKHCGIRVRPNRTTAEQYPGTGAYGGREVCHPCQGRAYRARKVERNAAARKVERNAAARVEERARKAMAEREAVAANEAFIRARRARGVPAEGITSCSPSTSASSSRSASPRGTSSRPAHGRKITLRKVERLGRPAWLLTIPGVESKWFATGHHAHGYLDHWLRKNGHRG